jgi:hypothetical protein
VNGSSAGEKQLPGVGAGVTPVGAGVVIVVIPGVGAAVETPGVGADDMVISEAPGVGAIVGVCCTGVGASEAGPLVAGTGGVVVTGLVLEGTSAGADEVGLPFGVGVAGGLGGRDEFG